MEGLETGNRMYKIVPAGRRKHPRDLGLINQPRGNLISCNVKVYKVLDLCRSNHIHGVEEDCKRIVNVFINKKL
jgi:hypothetical protein